MRDLKNSTKVVRKIFKVVLFFQFFSIGYTADSNGSKLLALDYRLNGKAIQNAFGNAKDSALKSTVILLRNDKLIALGGFFHPDGYILTKASSCVGAMEAETFDGTKYPLKIKRRLL